LQTEFDGIELLVCRHRIDHRFNREQIEIVRNRTPVLDAYALVDIAQLELLVRRKPAPGRSAARGRRCAPYGAAKSCAAAIFRAGEPDDVADDPEQRRFGIGIDGTLFTVH
jgi:hypothetical protein